MQRTFSKIKNTNCEKICRTVVAIAVLTAITTLLVLKDTRPYVIEAVKNIVYLVKSLTT